MTAPAAERGLSTACCDRSAYHFKLQRDEVQMDWNKDHIRETMLSLETAALQSARDKYLDYVSTARLDRSESIENDEQAQAEIARGIGSSTALFGESGG